MVLIREGLNHALHEILLSHGVFAFDNHFEDAGENHCLVDFESATVEHGQADDVLTNCDSELITLDFSLFFVFVA